MLGVWWEFLYHGTLVLLTLCGAERAAPPRSQGKRGAANRGCGCGRDAAEDGQEIAHSEPAAGKAGESCIATGA